jgi:hypothetical protein
MMDIDVPPPIFGNAKVLTYAVIDGSINFVQKNLLYVDGKPLGPVPKLAICKVPSESEVLLCFCDEAWGMLGVSAHDSPEAAKRRAEKSYPGLRDRWQPYHHENEAEIDCQCFEPYCSFCGKSFAEAERMIEGKEAWICEDCIRTASGVLGNAR